MPTISSLTIGFNYICQFAVFKMAIGDQRTKSKGHCGWNFKHKGLYGSNTFTKDPSVAVV